MGGRLAGAVVGAIGELVVAVEVETGGVAERAVGLKGEGAVERRGDQGGGEGLAFGVGVVGEDAEGGGGSEGLVFAEAVAIG